MLKGALLLPGKWQPFRKPVLVLVDFLTRLRRTGSLARKHCTARNFRTRHAQCR